jgi:hypothetical protein
MQHPIGFHALGMVHNDPLRGPVALRSLEACVQLPDEADGLGMATVVDGAALLSRSRLLATSHVTSSSSIPPTSPPTMSSSRSWASLVGVPRGRTTVLQVSMPTAPLVAGLDQGLRSGPFRARAYAASVVVGPHAVDQAAATRERLMAELPDFLRRCVVGDSEAEAFFLATLGRLHKNGRLEAVHENVDPILAAVHEVMALVDDVHGAAGPHRQVTLTNGVDVVQVSRGVRSAVMSVQGLGDDIAAAMDPTLADSSTARERNRRYRAAIVVGGLTGPWPSTSPRGFTVEDLLDDGAVVIGRDCSVRRV